MLIYQLTLPDTQQLCNIHIVVGYFYYALVKWTLYLQLSFRLDIAFKGSIYQISKKFQYAWRILF